MTAQANALAKTKWTTTFRLEAAPPGARGGGGGLRRPSPETGGSKGRLYDMIANQRAVFGSHDLIFYCSLTTVKSWPRKYLQYGFFEGQHVVGILMRLIIQNVIFFFF